MYASCRVNKPESVMKVISGLPKGNSWSRPTDLSEGVSPRAYTMRPER